MTPQHQIAAELVSHAGALRALARDLVGPTDAPDLVQETALRALRSPPERPHGLGAWLTTVLRNLAGNHRRNAARRREREAAIARGAAADMAAAPAPDDVLHRHESVRLVTEALWRLPEPYRSTLVRRYFEELTPKQIAEREGVPVATVKSRLQRGLAQLRTDCDREDGGQWRALLPLVLHRPETPVAAAGAAVFVMSQSTKIIVVAVAIVAIAGFALFFEGSPPAPAMDEVAGRSVVATGAARAASTPSLASAAAPDAAVERIDPTLAFQAALGHPHEMSLRCRIIDRDGLPVTGAQVAFGPVDGAVNLWPEPSTASGHVVLHWRAKQRTMRIALGLLAGGEGQSLRTLEIEAGHDAEITLLVATGGGGASCGAAFANQATACTTCHRASMLPNVFQSRIVMSEGLHPFTRFLEPLLREPDKVFDPPLPPPPFTAMEEFEVGATEFRDQGRIVGTVYDDRGQPVAGTTVFWSREPDRPLGRTRTGSDGSYVLTGVPPGDVRVRAGGGSSGIGRARVAVGVGLSTTQDVHLARGRGIVGRVLLPAGASAEGWRVEFEAHNGSWADSVEVRKNSTFEFANLPATRGRLLLWSQLSHPLPIAVQDVIEVGRPDVIFDLVATGMPGSVLRGRVGQMVENRVAIWHVASGRCTVRDAPPGGQFEFTGLAPGEYRLRAWLPTVGTLDLGGRWIDGTSEVDLGDLRFPEHAQVRVEWPEEPVEVECYRVGDDVDVRHPTWLTSGHGFELAAGRWFLLWREHGTLRMRRFETRAGEGAEVSLLPDPR